MSKKLTKDQVLALARLSRLKITDVEVERYQQELNAILEYVKLLDGVDTKGLKPTYQVTGLQNVMREDVVEANQPAEPADLLECAPRSQDGYIKVSRMI